MEKNKVIAGSLGLTVGIIILASALMPILVEAQEASGDPITLVNTTNAVLTDAKVGDVLDVHRVTTSSGAEDTWTYNGKLVSTPTGGQIQWNVAIISDGIYAQANARDNSSAGELWNLDTIDATRTYFGGSRTVEGDYHTTFTFGADTITVSITGYAVGGIAREVPYTWAKVICPLEDATYTAAVVGGQGFVNDTDDILLCGAYTSGSNKTMYAYKDGELYLSNPAYEGNVNISADLHEGTSDIYDVVVSVDVGSENFTPYRIYVPYEVSGHQTKGNAYSIYGAIPVVLLASFVVYAANMFRSKEE